MSGPVAGRVEGDGEPAPAAPAPDTGGEPEPVYTIPGDEPMIVGGGPGAAPAPVLVPRDDLPPPDDPEPVYTLTEPPAPGPDFRMALVSGVSVDLPNQHPTVVLRETESPRRQLSFSIGLPDAVVLSHALRRIPTPRPFTHELMSNVLTSFDIDIVAVRIVGRQGAVYFAELDLRGRTGRSVQSCRPTDGLTLALLQRVPVPILIDRRLFEVSGDVAPGS